MKHKCPVKTCGAQVPSNMLMCAAHWRMVPAAFQRAVWRHYRKEPGGEAHLAACHAATEAVEKEIRIAGAFGIKP